LAKSVNAVSNTIKCLIDEISLKVSNYESGITTKTMTLCNFHGCYKELADKMDTMINHMDGDFKDILTCICEFSSGNFDINLRPMPGERQTANIALDALSHEMNRTREGILNLTNAAVDGRIDYRIDTDDYNGDWKEIAAGLNSLLAAATEVYPEIIRTLKEIGSGNLSKRITFDYPGEYGVIKNTINAAAAEIYSYVNEISGVLGEMSKDNYRVSINRGITKISKTL
jgi:methyl-accepting chemotaxis protein